MNLKEAAKITGGLSKTTKMPGGSYSLPASACKTGAMLRNIPGTVCSKCYASKGRYTFDNTRNAMERRLKSLRNPLWTEAMATLADGQPCRWFRWHDSGDLQGVWHLGQICAVAEKLPRKRFFLPTKEMGVVGEYASCATIPANLSVRVGHPCLNERWAGPPCEGVGTSMVSDRVDSSLGHVCPATAIPERKTCGDCRACWERSVPCVVYIVH